MKLRTLPVLVAATGTLIACGTAIEGEHEATSTDALREFNTNLLNGRELNGTFMNGIRIQGIRIQGIRIQGIRIQGIRIQGPILNGIGDWGEESMLAEGDQFEGWVPSRLSNEPERYLYIRVLSSRIEDGTHYIRITYSDQFGDYPACPGGGEAIPVRGYWDDSATWVDDDSITLACPGGAIRKCIDWGYKPWISDLGALHQSCVRAARADYCGTGVSYTQEGTEVNFFDNLSIQTDARISDAGAADFNQSEALWDPRGAICLNETRIRRIKDLIPEWGGCGKNWSLDNAEDANLPPCSLSRYWTYRGQWTSARGDLHTTVRK